MFSITHSARTLIAASVNSGREGSPFLVMDSNTRVAQITGTTVRASNQVMALVLSGQFDFSQTYWVFNGIAGVEVGQGAEFVGGEHGGAATGESAGGDRGEESELADAPFGAESV